MRSPSHRKKGKLPRTASSDAAGTHIDEQPHTTGGPDHSPQSFEANIAIRPLFSSVRGREGVLSRRIAQYVEENEPPSINQATKRLLERHHISDFTSHSLGNEARLASLYIRPHGCAKLPIYSVVKTHNTALTALLRSSTIHDDWEPNLDGSSLSDYFVEGRSQLSAYISPFLDSAYQCTPTPHSRVVRTVRFSTDVQILKYCPELPPVYVGETHNVHSTCLIPDYAISPQVASQLSTSDLEASSRMVSSDVDHYGLRLATASYGVISLEEEEHLLEPAECSSGHRDMCHSESQQLDEGDSDLDHDDHRLDPAISEPWRQSLPSHVPNPWSAHIPNVSVGQSRRWDLSILPPKSLWFIDIVQLELPTVGGYQLALFCYDIKGKGWRFYEIKKKSEIGSALHRFVSTEGLNRRPYRVTIQGDGCGCMKIVQDLIQGDQHAFNGINYEPLPRNEPDLNPVEGSTGWLRERVYATLTHAMKAKGAIDERHLVFCAQYCCYVNERLPRGHDGTEPSAWQVETGVQPTVGHIPDFGCAAYVYIPEKLRKARKGPKYLRAEPALFLGFMSMYSTVYKFLTRHGTIVHSRRARWVFDVPAGVFPSVNEDEKHLDAYRDIETELFTRYISEEAKKLAKALDVLGDPDTVIRVNRAKIKKCKTSYIKDRVWAADGLSMQEATDLTVKDLHGQSVKYSLADIRYDAKCKWIFLEPRDDLDPESEEATTEEAGTNSDYVSGTGSSTGTSPRAQSSSDSISTQSTSFHTSNHTSSTSSRQEPTSYSGKRAFLMSPGGRQSMEQQLLRQYRASLTDGKHDHGKLMQISHALCLLAQRGLKWNQYLGSTYDAEVREAYHQEMDKLLQPDEGALRELFPFDPDTCEEYAKATAPDSTATWTMLLLEIKRSGRWKARLVIRGDLQDAEAINGPDFQYNSHVADLAAVRAGFLAPGRQCDTVLTIDLDNAYCQADRFSPDDPPRYLCMWDPVLKKKRVFRQLANLYGSRESGKLFELTFFRWLTQDSKSVGLNLVQGHNEQCVFYDEKRRLLVLTFVDDVCVIGPDKQVKFFVKKLRDRFACKDPQVLAEGQPIDFIGMNLHRGSNSMYISMEKYCETMYTVLGLDKGTSRSRPPDTPIVSPIEPSEALDHGESTLLLKALGMLGWLSITTRLDIRYAHSRISQHLGQPSRAALNAALAAVRYAYNTRSLVIQQPFHVTSPNWVAYSDADHAGNSELQNKRKSQTCFIIMNGCAPISWGSKASAVQMHRGDGGTVEARTGIAPVANSRISDMHPDLSSAAAEIYAAAIAAYEILYISYVCREAGIPYPEAPIPLLIDNTTCIAFAKNSVSRSKLKHIDCAQQWVLTLRDSKLLKPTYVHTDSQLADLGTKILSAPRFQKLRDQLLFQVDH